MTTGITILGATGSIGASTLDVLRAHPDRFHVEALTAHRQIDKLAELCIAFRPRQAVVVDAAGAQSLTARLRGAGIATEVSHGPDALVRVAADRGSRVVVAAVVGAAGLPGAMAAARAGKRVLLANKEALVMSGGLFMREAAEGGAELLPIDSEHNAIFQCLPVDGQHYGPGIARIVLTASGGPFRQRDPATLYRVTPDEACAHPNWSMGRKISVDSATMMNKGLEVIEAHWLFRAPAERIEVLIHPQSIVHSMVCYDDGSVLAQLGHPDMRTPIAHALAFPERIRSGVAPLDLARIGRLDFEPPDERRFPCLGLAFSAMRAGGGAPAVLNAANEIAVEAFLDGRIGYMSIADVVAASLDALGAPAADTLDAVLDADRAAREVARQRIARAA